MKNVCVYRAAIPCRTRCFQRAYHGLAALIYLGLICPTIRAQMGQMFYSNTLNPIFKRFMRDDSGASTVEMVIAMAVGLTLGLAVTQMVGGASKTAAKDTGAKMETMEAKL